MSRQGDTVMLVTRDMNLARRVSNRVLYMDEGGVYEDGSPEVIFENPAREKTRRFVRKLKTLDFRIDSQEFDFIGCNTEMKEFGLKNDIPKGIVLSVIGSGSITFLGSVTAGKDLPEQLRKGYGKVAYYDRYGLIGYEKADGTTVNVRNAKPEEIKVAGVRQ